MLVTLCGPFRAPWDGASLARQSVATGQGRRPRGMPRGMREALDADSRRSPANRRAGWLLVAACLVSTACGGTGSLTQTPFARISSETASTLRAAALTLEAAHRG